MNRNREKPFSIKLNETRDKVPLDGIDGYDKSICFPSAMWPVPGKDPAIFTPENTTPCTNETIRRIFDTLPFRVGRCYDNAEILAAALLEHGIQARTFCGWLLYADTIPTHHAVVLVGEDQVFDPATMDFSSMPPMAEGLSTAQVREAFAQWVLKQQERPRSETYTFGQVFQRHIYIMAELAPKKAIALRQKLERAYPKHPSFQSVLNGGYTALQTDLKKAGLS